MADFKKPFKAVPLKPKSSSGRDELAETSPTAPRASSPINWRLILIGILAGGCLGLAYVMFGA